MLQKTSTRFLLYEGTRVGEIQKATDGDMSVWAWIPGSKNIADCTTRGLDVTDLNEDSTWWRGPDFLYQDYILATLTSPVY